MSLYFIFILEQLAPLVLCSAKHWDGVCQLLLKAKDAIYGGHALQMYVIVSESASKRWLMSTAGVKMGEQSRGLGWLTSPLYRWRICWINLSYFTMKNLSASNLASSHSLGMVLTVSVALLFVACMMHYFTQLLS